jgi:hypothetical protein
MKGIGRGQGQNPAVYEKIRFSYDIPAVAGEERTR